MIRVMRMILNPMNRKIRVMRRSSFPASSDNSPRAIRIMKKNVNTANGRPIKVIRKDTNKGSIRIMKKDNNAKDIAEYLKRQASTSDRSIRIMKKSHLAAASGNTDREIRIMRKKDEIVPENEDQTSQSMNEAIRKLLTFSPKEIER